MNENDGRRGRGHNAGSAHKFFNVARILPEWFPESENGRPAKNADDTESMQIAQYGAAVGTGNEREEKFHNGGGDALLESGLVR
jgi:hypothetical protein